MIYVLSILGLVLVMGLIAGIIFFNMVFSVKSKSSFILKAPHNQGNWGENPNQQEITQWYEAQKKESVFITSFDQLKLHGTVFSQSDSHKWLLACHGYKCTGSSMKKYAKKGVEWDFNVLLPDLRGNGFSEGAYYSMGWLDRLDIKKWIEYIVEKDPQAEIVLFGISMGGATVLMTAGEPLPPNVKCVVDDCGYASIKEEFLYQLTQLFFSPAKIIYYFGSLIAKVKLGFFLKAGDAGKQLQTSTLPIFFIHGKEDTFVPFEMSEELFTAYSGDKEFMAVEKAGHGQAESILGEDYWFKIKTFIDTYSS